MAESICLQIPSEDDLRQRSGWRDLGDGTYSAMRFYIMVVKRHETKPVKGPAIEVLNLPSGAEYKFEHKKARIVKHTNTIQQSIQETVTTKLAEEVSQKIASEVGATGALVSAKLSSEVAIKSGVELTEAVQRSLTTTRSYEVQNSEEITRSVSVKPTSGATPHPPFTLHFYLGLWPWKWDFYLYRTEYLRLRYKTHWFWRDVRNTISTTSAEPKLPLFRVLLYEPQSEFSISEGVHDADVAPDDADEVAIQPLTDGLVKGSCAAGTSLEELARFAFPVTREEKKRKKKIAGKRAPARKPAKKMARKARFAKARAARKAPAKRAAAKRSSRRRARR